jgi:ketosteroid isomerase-like protein
LPSAQDSSHLRAAPSTADKAEDSAMSLDLPTPISNYFEAVNVQDVDAILSVFGDEASVRDEGQEMIGRAAIREWIDDTTRKYRVTLTPIGVHQADERTIVTAQVSGTFPGSPVELRYRFTISGEKIARLEVT